MGCRATIRSKSRYQPCRRHSHQGLTTGTNWPWFRGVDGCLTHWTRFSGRSLGTGKSKAHCPRIVYRSSPDHSGSLVLDPRHSFLPRDWELTGGDSVNYAIITTRLDWFPQSTIFHRTKSGRVVGHEYHTFTEFTSTLHSPDAFVPTIPQALRSMTTLAAADRSNNLDRARSARRNCSISAGQTTIEPVDRRPASDLITAIG